MNSAGTTIEDRIRERAYYIWETYGRPTGGDEEFWHRAREIITTQDEQPKPRPLFRNESSLNRLGRRAGRVVNPYQNHHPVHLLQPDEDR